MTDRELRELKRRLKPEKCTVSRIRGCFVNSTKQILYRINQSLAIASEDVSEMLLGTLRKALSGSIGTTLSEINYSTNDVTDKEEHALLERIRKSSLEDSDALELLYTRISESLEIDSNYVILLASDAYDVVTRSSDGESGESSETHRYFILAICPVKESPEVLTFREADSLFHRGAAAGILSSPEIGIMYPAFDDRRTNIYGALYYTRSSSESYPDLAMRVLGKTAPMPRKQQKEAFSETINSTVGDAMSLDVIRKVQANVEAITEAHKESRDPEPLTLTKFTVREILENAGVEGEMLDRFGEAMDENFGKSAALTPKTVIPTNKFELSMPEVKISINPEYRDLVTVKKIDGESCIVIRVSGPATVNGIALSLDEDPSENR